MSDGHDIILRVSSEGVQPSDPPPKVFAKPPMEAPVPSQSVAHMGKHPGISFLISAGGETDRP